MAAGFDSGALPDGAESGSLRTRHRTFMRALCGRAVRASRAEGGWRQEVDGALVGSGVPVHQPVNLTHRYVTIQQGWPESHSP
jgi:hypothetical protein